MAVSDENELLFREDEGRGGGLVREHIFPDGVAGTAVVERDAGRLALRLEPVEEPLRLVGQYRLRPRRGLARIAAEL